MSKKKSDESTAVSAVQPILEALTEGRYDARVPQKVLKSKDKETAELGASINRLAEALEEMQRRAEEYHESSMSIAIGMSECFQVLAEVQKGNLTARVGDDVLESEEELMGALGSTLNDTVAKLQNQVQTIQRQQFAIQELSTPVLQLWDNVLALPIIGVVDTARSIDIMERLLSEISAKQSRYVILDITGVEIVDTKTADHFIKIIKAAELLGTRCIFTGIRPAVAQTLVEIGVDLASVVTLRNLQEGLKACLREMGEASAMNRK